jgi:hypothetical protein
MKKIIILLSIIAFTGKLWINAQDLDQLLGQIATDTTPNFVYGTFKGSTIINGQSVEIPGNGDFLFLISHRFGNVNTGIYQLFGLDQATTRFGFEYGLKDILSISTGRSSYDKTYDGGLKVKILRQQTGSQNIPITMTLYSGIFIKTLKWEVPERDNLFSSRLSYGTQLLIARKFNQKLSMQLSPSFVHKNLVPLPSDENNIFAVGFGGRYKLTKKLSLNGEYFYLFPGTTADKNTNSCSVGLDIETGGHVFQLHLTNSQAMFARGFITETTGDWLKGDIFLGFNIYRVFPLGGKSKNIY